jgi:hypothetical protein
MKKEREKEKLEVVRGSGNIFRDFGDADADVKQLKVILAAEIIKKLDRERLAFARHGSKRVSTPVISPAFAMRSWNGSPLTGL